MRFMYHAVACYLCGVDRSNNKMMRRDCCIGCCLRYYLLDVPIGWVWATWWLWQWRLSWSTGNSEKYKIQICRACTLVISIRFVDFSIRFRFWFTNCAIGDLPTTNCAIGGIPLLGLTDLSWREQRGR